MSLKDVVHEALLSAVRDAGYGEGVTHVPLEKPRHKEHGDLATPVAMSLARQFKKNPSQIAHDIAAKATFPADTVANVDVVKPGYINLRVSQNVLVDNLADVYACGADYGRGNVGSGVRCQIEYVSANPTGPLILVSARAAAVGSVTVNLLRFAGFDVDAEYYVNDAGGQVRALGESLRYRVAEHRGTLPTGREIGAYPGEYLKAIAAAIPEEKVVEWEKDADGGVARYGRHATEVLLESIRTDLEEFGVHFDNFFLESSLHPDGAEAARQMVEEKGYAYKEDGALFFRTSDLGDDKDRVIVKSDGASTYFLNDIAYHLDKYRRGYKWVIDILGPDHHGHVPRLKAAAEMFGAGRDWVEALIVGWVRLMESGKPISMSKRAGEIITMKELMDDVGTDVAKYFFLMRRSNSPLDFDLDLARTQSDENPVYYVQYAHARIASVVRFAVQQGAIDRDGFAEAPAHDLLVAPEERDLMVHLMFFPYVVEGAALVKEPHRLTAYAQELAMLFHRFYHECRVVSDDEALTRARLHLVGATQQVLKNSLQLLGVSAPESM